MKNSEGGSARISWRVLGAEGEAEDEAISDLRFEMSEEEGSEGAESEDELRVES